MDSLGAYAGNASIPRLLTLWMTCFPVPLFTAALRHALVQRLPGWQRDRQADHAVVRLVMAGHRKSRNGRYVNAFLREADHVFLCPTSVLLQAQAYLES